jgi:D-3-phosphoglycerate dehydrogenase / 2-oxoglutarate reductase
LLNKKNKIRILIADKVDLSGLRYLPPGSYSLTDRQGISNKEIIEKYNGCDVLAVRSTRKIDKHFLGKCGIKIIATFTKGTDHIDMNAAGRLRIKIFNSESGNSVSAAEHTFALILAVCKNIVFSDTLVRKNKFSFYNYKRMELRGKKIGIIGFGKVGSRVGKYASAFGMKVIANDIDPAVRKKYGNYNFRSLNYLLKNAEIVSVHIPLNSYNKNFISRKNLLLLSDKSILINTSRGEVLDEKYLIDMLAKGKLYFAGLDVFRNEPKVDKMLLKLGNVVLTNHIAGKTDDSMKYISKDIFMQVKKHFMRKTKKNA